MGEVVGGGTDAGVEEVAEQEEVVACRKWIGEEEPAEMVVLVEEDRGEQAERSSSMRME